MSASYLKAYCTCLNTRKIFAVSCKKKIEHPVHAHSVLQHCPFCSQWSNFSHYLTVTLFFSVMRVPTRRPTILFLFSFFLVLLRSHPQEQRFNSDYIVVAPFPEYALLLFFSFSCNSSTDVSSIFLSSSNY